ncbi:hypothetical protein HDC92_004295 [Pedobacter sp. AK017]|uniref:hypothetical protein n=1 Tax=Pedobacter sp. AK017 TaxID=2723073 RepID=UPI00160E4B55|nr:hypothetical protein [Pedobacter sp. AK017]MBB5440592.1 hypothetical protein [Pedobacter sp. AK017]
MSELKGTIVQLKECMEMNNGIMFWSLLRLKKNKHFMSGKIRNPDEAYFEPDVKSIVWANEALSMSLIDEYQEPYDEIIIDVEISGTLNEQNLKTGKIYTVPVTFDFAIQSFVYPQYGVNDREIRLMNKEQKSLLLFHKSYEREADQLNVKLLFDYKYKGEDAFSFFTRIWKLVDHSNATMVADTSHDYFQEIYDCQRNLRYSVACANMWGRYTTHYTEHAYDFQGRKVYPAKLNFYDSKYLFYLENAVEELYTFYERLAYLMYLMMDPVTLEAKYLSFQGLFQKRTKKELKEKYPHLAADEHFIWFSRRANHQHKLLSRNRHPLIHYQTGNEFIKGSYLTSFTRGWLNHATGDEKELMKVFQKFDEIKSFVNSELIICTEAFERTILLIDGIGMHVPGDPFSKEGIGITSVVPD